MFKIRECAVLGSVATETAVLDQEKSKHRTIDMVERETERSGHIRHESGTGKSILCQVYTFRQWLVNGLARPTGHVLRFDFLPTLSAWEVHHEHSHSNLTPTRYRCVSPKTVETAGPPRGTRISFLPGSDTSLHQGRSDRHESCPTLVLAHRASIGEERCLECGTVEGLLARCAEHWGCGSVSKQERTGRERDWCRLGSADCRHLMA